MTLINASVFNSGSLTPLAGYVQVTTIAALTTVGTLYVQLPVKYPLVAGLVTFDLVPSDIAKVSYRFEIYLTGVGGDVDSVVTSFEAVVPFSATAIPLVSLASQSGIRYDKRDASLLTLARYLTSNDSFMGFLGNYLWANKGTYAPATIYKRGDVVYYNTSSYQYITSTPAAGITPTAGINWAILVSGSGGGGGGGVTPNGLMFLYPTGAALPSFYLRCNGTAVSRTTYSALFSVIGTAYGAGDGSTTFNLPDSPISTDSSFVIFTGV